MDKQLRRLETFVARGSDGKTYSVHGFEHLGRVDALQDVPEQWEPLGVAEYKLADGRPLREQGDGSFVVVGNGLELKRDGSVARGDTVGKHKRQVDHGAGKRPA
ncbi:MAG: hypothetical protein ABI641_15715 [Caldimonas sp.]